MALWNILGQDHLIAALERSLRQNQLAHAYLLVGPPQVGKTTLAFQMAQAVNCLENDRPCGRCRQCQRVERGLHADVQVIAPDRDERTGRLHTEIGIDQVRALERTAALGPYEGRCRVFIVEGAERMSLDAANALLKTLEEPPPQVVLILICRNPRMLPLTVLSRCQIVRFRPLAEGEFVAALGQRGVATGEARLLARICQGRLGLAMEGEGGQVIEQRNQALDLLRGVREKGAEALFVGVEPMGRDRPRAELILEAWRLWYRDLLWLKAGAPEDGVVNSDCLPELHRQVAVYSMEEILRDMETLREIWQALQSNVSPRLGLEVALMTIGLDRKAA